MDTQTAYLLALRFGLSNDEKQMEEGLIRKLKANGGKLQTGFVGTPLLCEELTKIGEKDMAYDLLFNEEYPGWLYEVNLGATTIWERWNSMLSDGSVSSTGMNSFNHYSYGAIVDWLYERVAGLRRNPAVPGFRSVQYAPVPDIRLGKAEISYESAAGTWRACWEAEDETHIKISLHVPFHAHAEVTLPLVPESVLKNQENPLFEDVRNGICYVGSGDYSIAYETTAPMRKTGSTDTAADDQHPDL